MEEITDATLEALNEMPAFLERAFARLSHSDLRRRPSRAPDDFAFVEQVWHLADLEREGYGQRIRRIIDEREPALPDFDGARIALERNYSARDAREALTLFRAAREHNVAILRRATPEDLARRAVQDEVGRITLADVPRMMSAHDASHRREIDALLRELAT